MITSINNRNQSDCLYRVNTLGTRRSRRIWSGNDLSGLDSSDKRASHLQGGGLSITSSMSATEIKIMEAELQSTRDARTFYDRIRHMVREGEVLKYAREYVDHLEVINGADNMYHSEKDELFVGDWSIATPEIYHRHKELGTFMTMDGMAFNTTSFTIPKEDVKVPHSMYYETHIMWDAAGGECGLCREHLPGEIMMMHKFYQF